MSYWGNAAVVVLTGKTVLPATESVTQTDRKVLRQERFDVVWSRFLSLRTGGLKALQLK